MVNVINAICKQPVSHRLGEKISQEEIPENY